VDHRVGLKAVAKIKNHCPYRESNPGRTARSAVTILLELLQLLSFPRCDQTCQWRKHETPVGSCRIPPKRLEVAEA